MAFAHSRCTSCAAPRCTPRISRGNSFGIQCRYKPSPNILIAYSGNTSQKVESGRKEEAEIFWPGLQVSSGYCLGNPIFTGAVMLLLFDKPHSFAGNILKSLFLMGKCGNHDPEHLLAAK